MKKHGPHFLLLLTFLLTVNSFGQGTKMIPRNEVYKDSALTTFICKLQYAIMRKDAGYLLSVVDKNVKNSFGGNDGIEEFKKAWKLEDANSPVWLCLSKLISLGGTFADYKTNKGTTPSFVFPYVFNIQLPHDSIDVYSVLVITGDKVNVRQHPDKAARAIDQLNYDMVLVDYEKSSPQGKPGSIESDVEKEWLYVSTLDKKIKGYVFKEYTWSPVGYRLFLNKIDGQWKITCLLAGD